MKKILLTILGIIIWAIIATAMSYLQFKYKLELLYSGSFIGIVATLLGMYFYYKMKNRTFKNPFKLLAFWFRYKRVDELVHRECDGCCIYGTKEMFNCTKSGRTEICLHTNKIFAKRSFNTLKWLKKLLFICIIALLFSSCSVYVKCNFNEVPKHKVTQQDSTVLQINEYWF